MKYKIIFLFICLCFLQQFAYSQVKDSTFYITKGKGFEFHFFQNQYQLNVDFRGQFRASYPYDNFPKTSNGFEDETTKLGINRARIKIGGHVFKPYYTYYFEQDIKGGNLLDFRVQIEKLPFLKLRVGQWKARYSRERVISSGKQQGLDRSLLNRIFTIDRQQGISLFGNLNGSAAANFNYWLSAFTGTGRGNGADEDANLMYLLRLQWNPNGTPLKFLGSDLEYHKKFILSIAIAGVTNTSPYTAFSTDGGGQLIGFETEAPGLYKVNQLLFETAFKYRGFSWQQEFHIKNIEDKIEFKETLLIGNYVQLGYFLHHSFSNIPKSLELYIRQSFYDSDYDVSGNNNNEYTMGCNWFFKGHKNKLTLEYSYLEYQEIDPVNSSGSNIRLQWDLSIF